MSGGLPYFDKVFTLGGQRFGITHDLVYEQNEPYLERWILWLGFTIRLHKFHKGDDDRAFHDHPWWFITMPLRPYVESVPGNNAVTVGAWRPHFRSARHRHIVRLQGNLPVWTFIITGPKAREWGFWNDEDFIHHEQWLAQNDPLSESASAGIPSHTQ